MPSKDLFFFSVYFCHNFRCILCSPLREKMRHFIIIYSAFLTKIDPSLQFRKIKTVFSFYHLNFYQLSRCTFQSDSRIKRRCKKRSQHHITAALYIFLEIILQYFPMFLREYIYMIIIGKAVCMHPFCVHNLLLRKFHSNHR